MKRRDLMKVGAVSAGAGLGVPGCAVPRLISSLTGADGAAAFNAMLDQQLAAIDTPGLLQRLLAIETTTPRPPEVAAMIAEKDALFRRMLGTLLVTQGFRELPVETQREPAVQARMWSHMDEIGSTVFEVGDLLATLDDGQRARVQQTLRDQPDLPMTMGEAIDGHAASAGLSRKRRHQLRAMMSQSAFRLRHSDAGSLIDEYVTKVERVRARGERDGDALDAARQVGERSFWQQQHRMAAQATPGAPATSAAGPGAVAPTHPQVAGYLHHARAAASRGNCQEATAIGEQVRALDSVYFDTVFARDPVINACVEGVSTIPEAVPARTRPGKGVMRAGGYMMGIGVVTFGVSLVLVDAAEGFLIGMTIGAVLFSIGLLIVLIGAIMYAASA